MSCQPESLQRVTYVDFLNAIVIGSAIQLMAPLSVSFKFFAFALPELRDVGGFLDLPHSHCQA
jgi:hypothetical protein